MIKNLMSKLSKIQSIFCAVLVAGALVSCDKEGDVPTQEPEFTQEELAEMAAAEKFAAANSVYRALALIDELPDNWEGATYTPAVGVAVDEANADVRNVISTDADHAKGYFLSIVPDEGLSGNSWSHEGVGTLTYRTVNEANCYAVIDVDLVQMPGLKQLRFVPEEVVGENSFSGTPYYCAGDIVKDKKGIYWICVRPSGGPLKKDYAYFVSFDKSLIKTVEQKQDIYKHENGKVTKEKVNAKSGQWIYAKNLVEERIALAAAHTFAMMFGNVRVDNADAFVDYKMALDYYTNFGGRYDKMKNDFVDLKYLLANFNNEIAWNNANAFAVAYGSYVKNKTSKVRQEKYLQPFLLLMHDGQVSEDGIKMLETVVKSWHDPQTGNPSSMPYSLTTDYDPFSFEYFSEIPMKSYVTGEGETNGYYGIRGKFDINNYVLDVKPGERLQRERQYLHMYGVVNDYVMVLTQTSVKDNGKAHKDFTEVCKSQNFHYREPAYWDSLDQTERLVYGDGDLIVEKNIYE